MATPPPKRAPLLRYAAGWVVIGAATAALLIVALRGCHRDELPPLRRTSLEDAARDAGCRTVVLHGRAVGNPPAYGPAGGRPLAPGFYERAQPIGGLVAAARRGVIVVHYRAPLDDQRLEELRLYRDIVPRGTIVTANATRMPFAVAAVGWRQILGCPRFSDAALEALRLFRARNLGRGPDAPP